MLQTRTPAQWLIREVTERDYGVDAYVELVTQSGDVTGDLCSVQLKGTESIDWKTDSEGAPSHAIFSGTKIATINYWMNLPVPVFLTLADLNANRAYCAPVKEQVREQYRRFITHESLSFRFSPVCELGTRDGEREFILHYYREKHHSQFVNYLRVLLTHWYEYIGFIRRHQMGDCHLEVEEQHQLQFVHLYKTLRFLSQFFGIDWTIPDINDIYRDDQRLWERQRLVRDFGITLHLLETCFGAVRASGVSWPVGGRGVRDSAFDLAATMPSPETSLKARFSTLPAALGG
ncbi:hypothetical protein GCM10023156_29080 [Novipirellula rosea]|uniref:DUF4365 domain-containing protein n=1 Tax=Novipirellula rosea TaxID=1031540 RepID=A0ABP8MSP4_9BACT